MVLRAYRLPLAIREVGTAIPLSEEQIRYIGRILDHSSVSGIETFNSRQCESFAWLECGQDAPRRGHVKDDAVLMGDTHVSDSDDGQDTEDDEQSDEDWSDEDQDCGPSDNEEEYLDQNTYCEKDGAAGGPTSGLTELVFGLCLALCTQPFVDGQPQKTALVYLSGVLGFSDHAQSFRAARSYTSDLSGLIYIQRLLFLECAIPLRSYPSLGISCRPRMELLGRLDLAADRWSLHDKLKPPSDFIWHNEDGPWDTPQMTAAVSRLSQHYMGRRITLQDWRHIAIAISKKHARQRGAAVPDFEDDEEHDESENYEVPDDLAACHTGQTAANYGVTIDILKRLTAESLEVFGQVSHRWHKFLEVPEASLERSRAPGAPATKRTQAAAGIAESQKPTRPKVLQLKKEESGSGGGDDCILRALRTVLRNDDAQFRSPQQELAVRAAAAKDTPLVAVLPTGGGKSLVFMVPAMSGVTIVVAPYAELKRQLVTRCLDAGLECKHWPEARESWPRVVIVSAEAASSDDFLQWAADLRVRDRLDRVVIDECHLMFTAANEYRRKLRALVLLRNLGCAFVFLTGTLPPLCQREFGEAMQLQNPLYIRASSHRTNVEYLVQRVGNGRGVTEVIQRAKARLGLTTKGGAGKGIVYCATHAKCQMLARQLKCHYYHGTPDDADAHFFAQREEGFQAWLRGESPYIVATSALGTGIDVPGITHVIHFGAPYSIIDYAQEAGRAGRAGERVEAVIVVEERDWPTEDPKTEAALELKTREVNALIRTSGCRRSVLGRCLDNDLRDCDRIDAVPCDNCQSERLRWKSELSSQGQIMSEAYVKKVSRGMQRLQSALETVAELQSMACVICWMFEGSGAANHKWGTCNELDDGLSFVSCIEFQRGINYRRDPQAAFLSCYFCHVSQGFCTEGYQTRGESCRRKHVVIPVAYAASTDDGLWGMVQKLAGRKISNREDYVAWLGRKHGKPVCGQEMTNAMAVFNLVVEWREGRKIQ
ncbi:recq family helicase [Purpureocillium lavendulum]|uniref:DNA 3'-5' helicase n=1 Tax=Purpureocillium lavendulum TaxID=1247861 RepID=A0AB34FH87_9HYPO|nr:recq family helicase [Purpureocillium lavendulum]